jgi:pimeloyl-ACP methyl ester carboxylesterase
VAAASLALVLLTACDLGDGSGSAAPDDSTSVTDVALPAVEPVTVGDKQLATRCAGDRQDPAVLLVAGFDTALDEAWDDVQAQIGGFARVCAYDRLGVGGSEAPPRRQGFGRMADDLDGVVDELGLRRPVVLVAHSLGGTVAVTWAQDHADDLAGLVLVDATPPSYVATALDILPTGSAPGSEVRRGLQQLLDPRVNAEHLDGGAAFADAEAFRSIGDVPLIALTHSISDFGGELRPRDAAALDSAWTGGQQKWAELSSQGRVLRVDRAGHFIQHDQPRAVIEAVREVVDAG